MSIAPVPPSREVLGRRLIVAPFGLERRPGVLGVRTSLLEDRIRTGAGLPGGRPSGPRERLGQHLDRHGPPPRAIIEVD
jgi:hypothetical protein